MDTNFVNGLPTISYLLTYFLDQDRENIVYHCKFFGSLFYFVYFFYSLVLTIVMSTDFLLRSQMSVT